jgi:hypothetical protein
VVEIGNASRIGKGSVIEAGRVQSSFGEGLIVAEIKDRKKARCSTPMWG